MSKEEGQAEALARGKLAVLRLDVDKQLAMHGFPLGDAVYSSFRMFGKDVRFCKHDCSLIYTGSGEHAKQTEHILLLHYLACETPMKTSGTNVSFRDLPAGQFYWTPFLNRTVNPLIKRYGNDTENLRKALGRFDWTAVKLGDLGANIHCFGNIYVTLAYHVGDEEFAPTADVLFDSNIKHLFCTEDAVVLASTVCLGLL